MRAPSRRRMTATAGTTQSPGFYFNNVNFLVLVKPDASIR
jgi:hypothetical protein